jgi:DNA-binding NarL/FixJ family response regulator
MYIIAAQATILRMHTSIYLIEDDTTVRDFVVSTLLARPDWKLVGYSGSLAHAQAHAAEAAANVYLVDLGLPDGRGEDILKALSKSNPGCELLVFTVFGDETRLIGAIEAGATGYVLKGCTPEELVSAIEQIQEGGAPISSLLARLLLKRLRSVQDSMPPVMADALAAYPGVILSERETDVLKLVAQGYVNKEIARKLDISGHTVGSHIKNLYRKLAVHTRVQVVRIAQERGLV